MNKLNAITNAKATNKMNTQTMTKELLSELIMTDDLPETYEYICFNAFGDLLKDDATNKQMASLMVELSRVRIKYKNNPLALANAIQKKSIKEIEKFIKSRKSDELYDNTIFRHDPYEIMQVYLSHTDSIQATQFMRYVLHSKYLPSNMTEFIENYRTLEDDVKRSVIPSMIYTWHEIAD
jgi:hypothetical protein